MPASKELQVLKKLGEKQNSSVLCIDCVECFTQKDEGCMKKKEKVGFRVWEKIFQCYMMIAWCIQTAQIYILLKNKRMKKDKTFYRRPLNFTEQENMYNIIEEKVEEPCESRDNEERGTQWQSRKIAEITLTPSGSI